ncbi:hypothetical protein D3C87_755110 [compost metagenome]
MEELEQTADDKIEILEAKLEYAEKLIARYLERDMIYQDLIAKTKIANFENLNAEERLILITKIRDTYVKGKHMEIFESAIRENELVAGTWNKFMVALRLCGYDEVNDRGDF